MNKYLLSYIENSIIREHAHKDRDGYHLEAKEISEHDLNGFLQVLFDNDPITKELILDRMNDLIEEHISDVESQDRYHGLTQYKDRVNGETRYAQIAGNDQYA